MGTAGTDYGKLRPARLAVALGVSTLVFFLFRTRVDDLLVLCAAALLPTSFLLGVAFRLYDLEFIGLRRVNRNWFMSSRTWPFDFALRGYFHFEGDEPLLH